MLGGVFVRSAKGTCDPRQIDVRNVGFGEVAGDDLAANVVGLPFCREVIAEFARDGIVAAWADINF